MIKFNFLLCVVVFLGICIISGCGGDSNVSIVLTPTPQSPTATPVSSVTAVITANIPVTFPDLPDGTKLTLTGDKNCRGAFGTTSMVKPSSISGATPYGSVYALSFCSVLNLSNMSLYIPIPGEGYADGVAYSKDGVSWIVDGSFVDKSPWVNLSMATLSSTQALYFVAVKRTGI